MVNAGYHTGYSIDVVGDIRMQIIIYVDGATGIRTGIGGRGPGKCGPDYHGYGKCADERLFIAYQGQDFFTLTINENVIGERRNEARYHCHAYGPRDEQVRYGYRG